MADTPENNNEAAKSATANPTLSIETGMDTGAGLTTEIGSDTAPKQEGSSGILDVTSGEIESLTEAERQELAKASEGVDGEEGTQEATTGETKEAAEETTEEAALPDFDAAKPETVAAYKERFQPNGKLDLKALGQEWFKNAGGLDEEALGRGKLNAGTVKFLNSLGIDDATINEVSAAQVARIKAESAAAKAQVVSIAGSEQRLADALKWGRDGGYTAEQVKKFNAAYLGTDPDLRADAVVALMARFDKANPPGRRASPAVTSASGTAAKGTAAAGEGGFESHEAWRKAFNEAQASKDPKKVAAVRERLKKSAFFKGAKK